jgi:hypothetical protein
MVAVAGSFRSVLDGRTNPQEAMARMEIALPSYRFSNGFLHGTAGHQWLG